MWRYPPEVFARPVFALAAVAAVSGCGDVRISYGDTHCPRDPPPAVVVEFVARGDGRPVAVGATGVLTDGPVVEQMFATNTRYAGLGRTYALAGAYDRAGIYDVRVETAFGEILNWTRIKVSSDRCGPFTVVLQAPLTLF